MPTLFSSYATTTTIFLRIFIIILSTINPSQSVKPVIKAAVNTTTCHHRRHGQLSEDYYAKTCPDVEKLVGSITSQSFKAAPAIASATIKIFFHDCFVQGCDASILISSKPGSKELVERDASENKELPNDAFEAINKAKALVESKCPGVVSCADILTISTRDYVHLSDPLPSFYQARSMLTLEESGLAKEAIMTSESAMVAASNDDESSSFVSSHSGQGKGQQQNGRKQHQNGRKNSGGRGGGKQTKGGNGGRSGKAGPQGQRQQQMPFWGWGPYTNWGWPQWAAPPCPMPTQGWAHPSTSNNGPGVLGPRPQQQAYQASTAPMAPSFTGQTSSYVPTDIASAMHTMTLNPPDPTWYMDTGATSHMTSSNGFSDGDTSNEV